MKQAVLHLVLSPALPNAGSVGVLVRYQPRASEPVDSSLDSDCQEGLGRVKGTARAYGGRRARIDGSLPGTGVHPRRHGTACPPSARQRRSPEGLQRQEEAPPKKNIILTEKATGEVLGLGATQPGSKYDKASVDEEHYTFPDGSTVFQDKGFQGYAPEGATIQQPTKKPRGKEWTPEQKEENRQ